MPKIDLAAYKGREQAFVKHSLLANYLPQWAMKIGSAWDGLVYIDGFAGPWGVQSPGMEDSSFGVATASLREAQQALKEKLSRSLPVKLLLVERSAEKFPLLESYARDNSGPGFEVRAFHDKFARSIPELTRLSDACSKHPFRFVLADPKGWTDIPIAKMAPFLNSRSCEVLVNLMTKHIVRFPKVASRRRSYDALFGRPGVLERLQQTPAGEKAEVAVGEYCESLRVVCGFPYVSSAVVLEPEKEAVRYYLIYGTHSHVGIKVFKNAEAYAAGIQEQVRQEIKSKKDPQIGFDFLPPAQSAIGFALRKRYCQSAKLLVQLQLLNSPTKKVLYREIYCLAMSYPLVTETDLRSWLVTFSPAVELEFAAPNCRVPSTDRDDYVAVKDREALIKSLYETRGRV